MSEKAFLPSAWSLEKKVASCELSLHAPVLAWRGGQSHEPELEFHGSRKEG